LVRFEAKRGYESFVEAKRKSAPNFPPTVFPAIKKYLDNKERKVSDSDEVRLGRAATLLGELGRQYPEMMKLNVAEGEKLLRSAAAKIGKKGSLLPVANFLANCQSLDQSLDLCEQLLKDLPPTQVVPVAVVAVTLGVKPNVKQVQRVETWVRAGQRQDPKALAWEGFLAALKERQEKYTEAEDLYRKILAKSPGDPVALNNLAFLLALQGKAKEAFPLIQQLDALAAINAEILDTRAVVLFRMGKAKEAEKDLREAIRQQKTAYRLFHLAQLYQSRNDAKKTTEFFEEAWKLGLRSDTVHALERTGFQDIYNQWNQSK
jgi:tetratricopeptide (TPR) repeat protein